jgi:hypothetical protein
MDYEKFSRLIDVLQKKTAAGELVWEQDPYAEFTYVVNVGSHRLFISVSHEDPRSDPDFYLGFMDVAGNRGDSVSDVDLKDAGLNAFSRMRRLYSAAKRSSTGFTKKLNEVLDELDPDDKPPF